MIPCPGARTPRGRSLTRQRRFDGSRPRSSRRRVFVTPCSPSQAVRHPRDWLVRAQAVIDTACTDLAPADAAMLRSALRRLARALRALPMTDVRMPLVFSPSLLGSLTRLRTQAGVSRELW